jgi:hypothetical protein
MPDRPVPRRQVENTLGAVVVTPEPSAFRLIVEACIFAYGALTLIWLVVQLVR